MGKGYLSLISRSQNGGYVNLISPSKGGETAGSVASIFSGKGNAIAFFGGETAGSVASSSGSCSSSSCGSFSVIV